MSKFAYDFYGKWPQGNEVFGVKVPRVDGLVIAVGFDKSSNIPLRVRNGELLFARTRSENVHKVVDIVFKITGDKAQEQAEPAVFAFLLKVKRCLTKFQRHTSVRVMQDGDRTYIVCRVYKNRHYTCQEHPELLLGKTPELYRCPCCSKLLVGGMPHV